MKRYYARGGLNVLQPAPAPAVSYYTLGAMPQEIWPMRNDPPLSQAQEDAEADLLGEDPAAEAAFAEGGKVGNLRTLLSTIKNLTGKENRPFDQLYDAVEAARREGGDEEQLGTIEQRLDYLNNDWEAAIEDNDQSLLGQLIDEFDEHINLILDSLPPSLGGMAQGGIAAMGPLSVLSGGGAPRAEGPVAGPGTGRSDDIDARLSDGEYVFDAETVALLGDGSTAAGAEALDQMREAIRAHKGKALAKGKFSPAAKSPMQYLLGDK